MPPSSTTFPIPSSHRKANLAETAAGPDRPANGGSDFLTRLAVALCIPPDQAQTLGNAQPFAGPLGLTCRVHVAPSSDAVRPEVLLPLSLSELDAAECRRLLVVQAQVLSELGWYLGASPEGLLMLAAVQWIPDPHQAAAALDLAQHVARHAISELIGDVAIQPEHSA